MQTNKRLTRSYHNRQLAGVCGGIGESFGVDPTLIRLALVLFTLLGGAGVLLYLVLWVIMPDA